jgi:transcription initiation factor TFIIB
MENYDEYFDVLNGLSEKQVSVDEDTTNHIMNVPEWRYYGSSDTKSSDPTRCGMPVNCLLPESSVGTIISNKWTTNKSMMRVRQYQMWNGMTYKDRSRYKVYTEIDDICNRGKLSSKIKTEAKSLYKIISDNKISRGKNRKGIIAACVYFSCKACGVPRSTKEIAEAFNITTPVMTKGCKQFQNILNMSKKDKNRMSQNKTVQTVNPKDFILRFCNHLKLCDQLSQNILKLCDVAESEHLISENTPPSIASGCIYLVCKFLDNGISKKKISETCKISEVTINKCFKKLEGNNEIQKNLQLIFSKEKENTT